MEDQYNRILEKLKMVSIEECFGLANSYNLSLNIRLRKEEHELLFTIVYLKEKNCSFLKLPLDITKEIAMYNADYIELNTSIVYSMDYPFQAPRWSLLGVKHNLPITFNLENYFGYIIDYHTLQNANNWSAGMDIETDIVSFLEKINYFEYIVELR